MAGCSSRQLVDLNHFPKHGSLNRVLRVDEGQRSLPSPYSVQTYATDRIDVQSSIRRGLAQSVKITILAEQADEFGKYWQVAQKLISVARRQLLSRAGDLGDARSQAACESAIIVS